MNENKYKRRNKKTKGSNLTLPTNKPFRHKGIDDRWYVNDVCPILFVMTHDLNAYGCVLWQKLRQTLIGPFFHAFYGYA